MRHTLTQMPIGRTSDTIYVEARPASGYADDPAGGQGWNVLRNIWLHKWLIVVLSAVGLIGGYGASKLIPPRYTAEARIHVGVESPNVTNFVSVLKGMTPNADVVQSEAYLVASREVAASVVRRLALDEMPEFNPALRTDGDWKWIGELKAAIAELNLLGSPPERDAADDPFARMSEADRRQIDRDIVVSNVLRSVEVLPLAHSYIVSIAAETLDPLSAAAVANGFAKAYVEDQLVRKRTATTAANEWLNGRIAELREAVEVSERKVANYRREHGLEETKSDTVIAQQLAELNREMVAAENDEANARSRLARAEALLKDPKSTASLPAVLKSPLIQTLRSQQAELERRAAELSATYTAKHPKMADIRAQIAEADSKIRAEIERILEGLKHEQQMAEDRRERVAAHLTEITGRLNRANVSSVQLRELERDAEANGTMLASLLTRARETGGETEVLSSNARIISNASIPLGPSFPPSALIAVVAGALGFGLGVLIALALESLDQTVRTPEEVENVIGLPALGLVPKLPRSRRLRDQVLHDPHSQFANSLRFLNAYMSSRYDGNRSGRIIMLGSSLPGEGKTSLSLAFGRTLAQDGNRVVVLDLDWRHPSLHIAMGQPPRRGLTGLLDGAIGADEAVYRDDATTMHAIFASDVPPSGIDRNLMWLDRLRLLLETLSRHYDVVLLDTPPLSVAPESLYLARLSDEIVYLIKWGSTARRVAAHLIGELMRVGGNVAGILLTQVDAREFKRYAYGGNYRYDRSSKFANAR